MDVYIAEAAGRVESHEDGFGERGGDSPHEGRMGIVPWGSAI